MHPRHHHLALAAALAIAVPLSASGQGIFKKVKEKAATVAGKAGGDKAAEKAGASSSSSSPRFSDNLVEITPARLDQLLRGAAAEAELARSDAQAEAATRQDYEAKKRQYESDMQTYEQRKKDYEARKAASEAKNQKLNDQMTAYSQCMQSAPGAQQAQANAMAMAQRMANMSEAERNALQKKLEGMHQRMLEAQKRGDNATVMRLTDSAQRLMGMTPQDAQAAGAAGREMRKCGAPPTVDVAAMQKEQAQLGEPPREPQAPVEPPRNDSLVAVNMARRDTTAVRAAGGLSVMQYGLMKERVAAYLKFGESPQKLGLYTFTPSELDALRARKDKLVSYSSVFNQDALGWVYWHSTADNIGRNSGGGRMRKRGT